MNLLPIQVKLIIAAGICAVLGLYGLWMEHHYEAKGRQLERAEWLQRQVQWDMDKAKLIADNQEKINQTIADNQAKERKISELHEQEIAKVHADLDHARSDAARNGGLRISASVCTNTSGPQASTETTGTSGRDEASTRTVALPEPVQDGLWSIVKEADEVSAQLRACQGWIKLNGFYGEVTN